VKTILIDNELEIFWISIAPAVSNVVSNPVFLYEFFMVIAIRIN